MGEGRVQRSRVRFPAVILSGKWWWWWGGVNPRRIFYSNSTDDRCTSAQTHIITHTSYKRVDSGFLGGDIVII